MKFYQLKPEERRSLLAQEGIDLAPIDPEALHSLNLLIENVVGQVRLPLGLVEKLIVNGQSYWVPMAIEEPSVVAAANHGAHIFAQNGGVQAVSHRQGIYGQIVLKVNADFEAKQLTEKIPALITTTNQEFASLIRHGGGLRSIEFKVKDDLLYLKVLVHPAEAMGANKTNSILEYLSKLLVEEKGIQEKLFAILSNYPSQRTTAKVALDFASVGGRKNAERIALLSQIAHNNVYRAVTNNKGIMNGVDAVLVATGNDYRAIEAACGVLASQNGRYESLSTWKIDKEQLVGELTLPMMIGTVGGSIKARKDIQQAFSFFKGKISSARLGEIITAIGLANNLTAMLAIATTGIQAGHMKLQARNTVASLDATDTEKKLVLKELIKHKKYSQTFAQKMLIKLRKEEK
ncbi:hydroxymethylglutaryl-CoA reductase [Lactobacillus xujianguonis]|uniref:Hydroxymethylglutaryl-CoA reductase n=1 Tax=Lactobacillus xujianguonis TaxID=2495899 RepID=A0A437SWL0_9LACO|nr:hydroxymethylglutaryl-CoA reductase [Lactobacillus xujianguonis]RVU71315.1 hydroxymethylglutaryl-CoA reductase [Lactobacillus xujianguonis]